MLKTNIPTSETYRSVTRPLIYSSLRKWLEYFGINNDVLIYFSGESEISNLLGTTFTDKKGSDHRTDTHFVNRLFVEAEYENADYNDGLDGSHRHLTSTPFWFDPDTETRITPVYNNKIVRITINRYFKDRVSGEAFINRINSLLRKPFNNLFSSKVHYPISPNIVEFLNHIYDLLNNVGAIRDNISKDEWINRNAIVPMDEITNIAGNNKTKVFKQSLVENGLLYDQASLSKNIAKGQYHGQYLASFSYSFYYAEHTEWVLEYPIMVYQQLINSEYIPRVFNDNIEDYATNMFFEAKASSYLFDYKKYTNPFFFVFPIEDNYVVPKEDWLDLQLQRLAFMEFVDRQIVLNLFSFSELDSFWDPTFEKYIRKFHNKVTVRHKNPMHLKLWAGNLAVLEKEVELEENGDFYLNRKPKMYREHRVAFYLDKDINGYDDECIKDIVEDEEYGRWIIDKVLPMLPLPGDPEYNGDKKPGDYPWIDWEEDINNKVNTTDPEKYKLRRTVHTLYSRLIAKNERSLSANADKYIFDENKSRFAYLRRKR